MSLGIAFFNMGGKNPPSDNSMTEVMGDIAIL